MSEKLKLKLEELKVFQDSFLKDAKKAYEWLYSRGGMDEDGPLLMRQHSYRDGYKAGWEDAQKELQEKLDAAIEHINKLLEGAEDQCRFDHNGNCQDHGWFAYDNSCHVASARDFLKARGEK